MTVNRSIFAFIKSPLFLLSMVGFMLSLVGSAWRAQHNLSMTKQCLFPVSYYDISNGEDKITLMRGAYRVFRDGITTGHMTIEGSITRFNKLGMEASVIPIHRELRFDAELHHNMLVMTVKSQSRQLGDLSNDIDIQDYVFPNIDPGSKTIFALYLLDGKVLASGTETVARNVCVN